MLQASYDIDILFYASVPIYIERYIQGSSFKNEL